MKKTITDYIKEIIKRSEKTKRKDFTERLKWRPVKALANRLDISPEESLVLSFAYFTTLTKRSFLPNDIRKELSEDPFDTAKVLEILDRLKEYRLLDSCDLGSDEFNVRSNVIVKISKNEIPEIDKESAKGTDFFALSDELLTLFFMRIDDMFSLREFYDEMDKFYDKNKQYFPFKYLIKHKVPQDEWMIFLYALLAHLNGERTANIRKGIQKLYQGIRNQFDIRTKLTKDESILLKKKMIEFLGEDFQSTELIKITDHTLKEVLKENYEVVASTMEENSTENDLIQPEKIASRNLYFNKKEKEQLKVLSDILQPEKLRGIQQNLISAGHREGVCILLHGKPGTGKTESVLQIAKSTGRPIMKVEISGIRDKFIGESEKNLKEIFTRYERIRRKSKLTPILLFNEADALLNKRIKVRQSSDQMNNAMQNILLEELENFKGVLFATTNLAPNMDKAFERRFLYKIEFMAPQEMIRREIWADHLPALDSAAIERIAQECKLSGGQIENVVKKIKLDHILYSKEIDIESIIQFCNEEFINSTRSISTKIGFKY